MMNRRQAQFLESEDSGSDWDTTMAESPTQVPTSTFKVGIDDNVNITPMPRLAFKDMEGINPNSTAKVKTSNGPKQEISQTKGGSQLISLPPHMTTFQSALSDYTMVHDGVSDIPSRAYESKGKLYTVPESESFASPQAKLASWDDSDAEERVLKEVQKNIVKDKQRLQAPPRERKVTLAGIDQINVSVENQGYVASPKEGRFSESVLEKWPRANECKYGKTIDKSQKCIMMAEDICCPSPFHPPSRSGVASPPVIAKETSSKKCVFYFEEGNLHFVEVEEDDVSAYLPPKVDEIEKIFRRVWREIFAVLHVVTSIFILFFAELVLFLAHHIVRPLVLDSISATGNYVLKPLLALLFNAVFQPIFTFLWNIFSALYQASEPLVKLLGYILTQVAIVLKSFRLFDIQMNSRPSGYRHELDVI